MKKRLVQLVGALALLSVAGGAIAGNKNSPESVHIQAFATYRYAAGQMGSVRSSASGNEALGCSLEMGTGSKTVRCYAADPTGAYMECTTGDDNMLHAVSSIGVMSRIYFTVG
jgi:hypothetical protein